MSVSNCEGNNDYRDRYRDNSADKFHRIPTLEANDALASFVEPFPQFLAGLEVRQVLGGDLNRLTGPRITSDTGAARLYGKRPETTEFDSFAPSQRGRDFVEHRRHDTFNIAVKKVRIKLRQSQNQLRPSHGHPLQFQSQTKAIN